MANPGKNNDAGLGTNVNDLKGGASCSQGYLERKGQGEGLNVAKGEVNPSLFRKILISVTFLVRKEGV